MIGVFFCGIYSCDSQEDQGTSHYSEEIKDAQVFFETEVEGFHEIKLKSQSVSKRKSIYKHLFWEDASIRELSFGRGIVVPIVYDQELYMSKKNGFIELSQMSYALFYKDTLSNWHAELVSSFPDEDYLGNIECDAEFTGLVLVEDWAGNLIKGFWHKNSEISPIVINTVKNKQSTDNNSPCLVTDYYDCTTVMDRDVYCFLYDRDVYCFGHSGSGTSNENDDYSPGGPSGTPDPSIEDPKVIKDSTFSESECLESILFSLKTGKDGFTYDESTDKFVPENSLVSKILGFFNSSDSLTVTYNVDYLPAGDNGESPAGHCKENGSHKSYLITLDRGYTQKATNLAIARTIIHESIHSYLYYVTWGMTREEQGNSKEFQALSEIYNNGQSNTTVQHEYMAGIANIIGNCLYDYAQINDIPVDRSYCSNMAWGGLILTDLYKSKVKNGELNNFTVTTILKREQNGELKAKGAVCQEEE